MKSCEDTYYCTVIVDTTNDRIVGAATLLLERKFIRNCSKVNNCLCFYFVYIVNILL